MIRARAWKPTALAVCLAAACGQPALAADPEAGTDPAGMLAEIDANGDGAIDPQEWEAATDHRFREIDDSGDEKISGVEIAVMPVPTGTDADRIRNARNRHYQRMDANGDGLVSRDEYMEMANRRFQALDRNGDNTITTEELTRQR